MKLFRWTAVLLLAPHVVMAGPTCVQRSQALLAALQAHDYKAATRHFDGRVAAVVSADKLAAVWNRALPLQFGAYEPRAKDQIPRVEGSGVVVTPLHFANGWVDMQVACNEKLDISAFRFVPGKAPPDAAAASARQGVSGAWGVSRPTHVQSPLGPLQAILTLPHGKGPFPAVVLVAGSGPHDADESVGPNKPFRDIARGLAVRGIASLRYAKRTYAYPEESSAGGHLTIDDEVTDDAVIAAHQLAKTAHVDPHRVFVLGHSLGAMLAPRIGQRDPHLAGLVMMAAPTRPLLEVLSEQVRELGPRNGQSARSIAVSEKAIAAERAALDAATPGHPPQGSFMHVPQSYWMSLHEYDQVRVAKSLRMPMLILQGGADFQVSPSHDFAQWKRIFAHDPRVTLHEYAGLSHLFMPAGKTGTASDYLEPGKVDSRVIDDIAAWIKGPPPRRR